MRSFPLFLLIVLGCSNNNSPSLKFAGTVNQRLDSVDQKSWPYFLQHLPFEDKPILDFTGKPVNYQEKHTAVVNYDIGTVDLQQCADALMRLRAEYLFQQERSSEIGFHFVSGQYYSWDDFCKGLQPVARGNSVVFIQGKKNDRSHTSLRQYLDLVYTYASTISLARELKPAKEFEIGVVVVHPGSPGHCFIIVDEKSDAGEQKKFKLVEGYTPAQSIYVLRNINEPGISPWYPLSHGRIETASYVFNDYQLGKFE